MPKKEDLLQKLCRKPIPKNFTKSELDILMKKCGCEKYSGGRGSCIAYFHIETKRILQFDEPHPGKELYNYQKMIFVFSYLYIDNFTRSIASKKVIDIVLKIKYYNLYIWKEDGKMDVVKTLGSYTIEDIYTLPDGERAELIDGQIYHMVPPSTRHQRLLNFIITEINMHIRENNGECEVFPAPFAVFLNKDDKNYVEPDISVICDKNKITDKGCNGAPDWVIEIISPGNKEMDYYKKLFKYQAAKVREYWIVDPIKEMVMVYRFEKETMEEYSFGEYVPVGIYEGFSIKVQ